MGAAWCCREQVLPPASTRRPSKEDSDSVPADEPALALLEAKATPPGQLRPPGPGAPGRTFHGMAPQYQPFASQAAGQLRLERPAPGTPNASGFHLWGAGQPPAPAQPAQPGQQVPGEQKAGLQVRPAGPPTTMPDSEVHHLRRLYEQQQQQLRQANEQVSGLQAQLRQLKERQRDKPDAHRLLDTLVKQQAKTHDLLESLKQGGRQWDERPGDASPSRRRRPSASPPPERVQVGQIAPPFPPFPGPRSRRSSRSHRSSRGRSEEPGAGFAWPWPDPGFTHAGRGAAHAYGAEHAREPSPDRHRGEPGRLRVQQPAGRQRSEGRVAWSAPSSRSRSASPESGSEELTAQWRQYYRDLARYVASQAQHFD